LGGLVAGYLNDRYGVVFYLYNQIRPKVVSSGGEQCFGLLSEMGVEFKRLGDFKDGICVIKDPVRIRHFPSTKLSNTVTLNCQTALDVANWFEDIKAKEVIHMGSYNCRKMRGLDIMSEHSFGSAFDIAMINGASVERDWNSSDAKGKYLKKAAASACSFFSNVLTPDYNSLHHDHFHVDNGLKSSCLPDWMNKTRIFILNLIEPK
jgi:hypothetical protein